MSLPTQARVVIIGGGVVGCSVAYHLAKMGWTDVVLLERKQLTSGTTWHAAGLIGQLRASQNMTRLARYSAELYLGLEAETGVATGLRQGGSVSVALTGERREELFRQAAMARAFGVPVEELSPGEVLEKYEHINLEGVTGGVWLPTDGQADPANIALALAKGARQNVRGIVRERVKVTGISSNRAASVTGVDWASRRRQSRSGAYRMRHGGELRRVCGDTRSVAWRGSTCRCTPVNTSISSPRGIDGYDRSLPVLRVPDECAYYKEDAG